MSTKPDDDKDGPHKGLLERLRAVGEAIEGVFDPDDDDRGRTPCAPGPVRPAGPQHASCPPITVNVNVTCRGAGDCRPCAPGTGGDGKGDGGRPVHTAGSSDGTGVNGVGGGGVVVIPQRPPDVWPGTRSTLCWAPYLFIRGNAGDLGARPLLGVFWESPDIFVLPGVAPDSAPPLPPTLGGVADANNDNTLYAHVWNLGQGSATQALVEFYWFDPSLGFQEGRQHLIGFTFVDLGPRGGAGSHKVVKCPKSWKATYLNGGHECLVVRISDPVKDPLSNPAWDASQNRHIGQRNIHVMTAAEAAAMPTLGIQLGPLFGQPAQIQVDRAGTETMPWLHLVTNDRNAIPATGAPSGDVGITAAVPAGANLPDLGAIPNPRAAGLIGNGAGANADGLKVGFVATDGNPGAGNAHVYRVSGSQGGQTFGGYTVVILGQ